MKNFMAPLFWTVVATVLVVWSISSSGPLSAFWDIPSVVITLFGSMAAVFTSFPLENIKKVPKAMKVLLFDAADDRVEMVQIFSELSKKARVNGILAIENDVQALDNELMKKGLQMIVDGKDGEAIQEQLELDVDLIEESYDAAPLFLNKWGEYAPAFGMIGTLIGLIVMLGELDDPSLIGTGMAVALITTFYGSFLSNVVFLPLATNIQQVISERMVTYDIILDGVTAIQEGKTPRDLEERLFSYLSEKEKAQFDESEPVSLDNLGKQEV